MNVRQLIERLLQYDMRATVTDGDRNPITGTFAIDASVQVQSERKVVVPDVPVPDALQHPATLHQNEHPGVQCVDLKSDRAEDATFEGHGG